MYVCVLRIQEIPEPIFFMESYVDDITNKDTSDMECEQTSELTEMVTIILITSITTYLYVHVPTHIVV